MSRRVLGFVLAGLVALAVVTSHDVPWSDDARFYVRAAVNHGRWLERVLHLDFDAFSRSGVDRSFAFNKEHPSVGKFAMGIGWLVLHHWTGLLSEIDACRAANVALWISMIVGVFFWLRSVTSPGAALLGAASLTAMPRLLYHAHAETLDLPIAAWMLLAGMLVWRAFESPGWRRSVPAVLVFGLALGTKLNAPFFLVGAVLYWLALHPPSVRGGVWLRLPRVPLVLIGLVTLSPVIAWLLWPWLWFDTADRLNAYLLFHLKHYNILYYFGGVLYSDDVAPWYAPALMTAYTMPVTLLGLLLAGAYRPTGRVLLALWGRAAASLSGDAQQRVELFALSQVLVQLAAVSLPTTPKYGGVKLFLPMLPFAAVLIGCAFFRVTAELARIAAGWRYGAAVTATALVVLLPGWVGAALHHGAWLSYYNELAGGLRGATEAGYERQYYDLAYPEMARAISRALPEGGTLAVLPNPKEYTPHLARWQLEGDVARNIRIAPPERADVLVLTHERRWSEYPELLARYRTRPQLARFAVAGVPMFSMFDLRSSAPEAPPTDVAPQPR